MEKFFGLKKNNTNVSTEIMAGVTTFFCHELYLIRKSDDFVSIRYALPSSISSDNHCIDYWYAGNGIVRKCTICSGTWYGIERIFHFYGRFGLGYSWQQALAMVFICGLINIFITVTNIRK